MEIWAIVLAAGKSERMGQQKLLLPFGAKTIIESVIDQILNAGIDRVLVVLGSDRKKIGLALEGKPLLTCVNNHFEEGMHTSVVCGFQHLPENACAALLFLGDQPFIPVEVTQRIVFTWRQSGKGIIIPTYHGKRGHPTLFDCRLKDEIMHLDSGIGLRSVSIKFPEEILEVEVNFPQILRDIDTKNDYINELNLIEQQWKKKSDLN
jgi:molybdenum cofactor cytidylyltransferase